jgi:hypothetical protein
MYASLIQIVATTHKWLKEWRVCIEERKATMHNDVEFMPKDLISLYIKQIPNWNEYGDYAYFG